MVRVEGHIEDTYWIIKNNDNSIIHYGLVTVGSNVESGLDNFEVFTIKESWVDRLTNLGVELSVVESDEEIGYESSITFEP